ncbi:MAG: DUF362 domain-containing protein [Promethearchaeota archaeon]
MTKVAIVESAGNNLASLQKALHLIGGIDDLNTSKRDVTVKVGIYHPKSPQHTSISLVDAIIKGFDRVRRIFLAESDNYMGTGSDRLKLWSELFSNRVVPFNLSEDSETRTVQIGDKSTHMPVELSHILFKPNIFVSTHVLRTFQHGSVLKNLFGLSPTKKKIQYHKPEIFRSIFADFFEAIGGIDLAVIDGQHLYWKCDTWRVPMNIIIVGRDAVAVETVGATLAGLKPEKIEVLQEFVKRGLGEGNLDRIEIVGVPFEDVREKSKVALKKLRELVASAPKPWSPRDAVDGLIRNGFFKIPHRRTREEIETALNNADKRSKGRWKMIYTTMLRRIKKGELNRTKTPEGWIYWTE